MPRKTRKKTNKVSLPRRSKPWFMSASLIIGVGLLAGMALISTRYMISNAAVVPEFVSSSPVQGAVFGVKGQYSDGSWKDLGTRTTRVEINSAAVNYQLTFLSAPAGYSFKQWRFQGGGYNKNKTITFATSQFDNQTITIDLYAPPPPPTPPPAPPATPPPPGPGPSPRPNPGTTTPPAVPAADTTPPTSPGGLTATMPVDSPNLELSWQISTDNREVKGYKIERSTDTSNWIVLADSQGGTSYIDSDIQFATLYFYRVAAIDSSGNVSPYVSTEITTNQFSANTSGEGELRVMSGDGIATYIVPSDSVDEEALCTVENYLSLGPTLDNYRTVAGPYELTCKNKDGVRINDFNDALAVSVQLPEDQDQKDIEHYGLGNEDWELLTLAARDEQSRIDIVQLGNKNVFIVIAKNKKSSPIGTILLVLLFVAAVVGAILFVLSRINRRKQEALYNDYFRKSRGL